MINNDKLLFSLKKSYITTERDSSDKAGTNLCSAEEMKQIIRELLRIIKAHVFSDSIFIMLSRSSQTLYFPTVCFKYMKYAWLFTFLQDCDKSQSCGHQGENISVDVLSVIFRCCTEALNVKHVVRV